MNRPVIELLTIDQWMEASKEVQATVLQHIRLKDRLVQFLKETWDQKKELHQGASGGWRPCETCEKKGWVPVEPRRPGIHPSQIPQPCLLRIWNEMMGKPKKEKIDPRTMLIFELGHAIHDMFQTYGRSGAWGPIYSHETEISGTFQELSQELMLEGHADAENVLTIDDIPGDPNVYLVGLVHEYKSINTNGFEKLTRPKPEHKMQAMVYSAALNRPVVVYMYFNKNDSNIIDFPVAFEPDLWVSIESKARILKQHHDAKVAPPAAPGFHCQQCPYMYDCQAYKDLQTIKKMAKKP